MTKLSCSQGFHLCGTNRQYLLAIRVLVVALVQALFALVQTHVDLVQALVALVQAQGGLIWVVRRQAVVGRGSGCMNLSGKKGVKWLL